MPQDSRKNIAIIGCGWLGGALAERLADRGYYVLGSTTSERKFDALRALGVHPFCFNLYDFKALDKTAANAEVIIVMVPPGRKTVVTEDYVRAMETLAANLSASPVRQAIFISSTSVYPDKVTVSEDDADPAHYLVKAEAAFKNLLPTAVIRFAGLIGPGRHPGRFLAGKTELTDAHAPVNLIHRMDCVNLIEKVIDRNLTNVTVNGCADQHPERQRYYTAAAKHLELTPPAFTEVTMTKGKTVDNTRAKRLCDITFSDINDFSLIEPLLS